MSGHGVRRIWGTALLAGLLGTSFPLVAQAPEVELGFQMRTGAGWALTLPGAMVGAGAFHVFAEGPWGVYGEAKITHDSPRRDRTFREDLSIASLETDYPPHRREPITDSEDWLLLNAGLIRTITPELAVIVGGGLARKGTVREYVDLSGPGELSDTGFYFVEVDELSGWQANGIVSALIRLGDRFALTTGLELAPRSFSLGLFWVFR